MNESDELSLPENLDAEQALLATCCAAGATGGTVVDDLVLSLESAVFVHPTHRHVWAALRVLVEQGTEVNSITLGNQLEVMGNLERCGGRPGIFEAISGEEVGRPQVLADLLRQLHARRLAMRAGSELIRMAADLTAPFSETKDDFRTRLEAIEGQVSGTQGAHRLIDLVLSGPELGAMEIQEREMIVEPFIATGSLNMVYAVRGLGKTFFGIELCKAVTTGKPFFEWHVPVARDVLFLDGEMPTKMLQERFDFLYGGKLPPNLALLPSEAVWTKTKPLNLNDQESQARIQSMLDALTAQGRKPALIIIDNLSSLSFGTDENDNSVQDDLLRWLMGLRHQGYAVLLVHHAGKGGDQRGASRREDFLDTSIRLSKPETESQGDGAAFKIDFTKERGRKAVPNFLTVALETGKHGEAIWSRPKIMPEYIKALLVIKEQHPKNYTALSKLMDITRQAATKHVEKLREKGLLHPIEMAATAKGIKAIEALNGVEVA